MNGNNDYYECALKHNINGQYQEAFEAYSKAIELNPDIAEMYVRRGTLAYRILKKYEDALVDFEKVTALMPGNSIGYLHRGIIKCHLLKFEEALLDFNKTIELDPNEERAFFNRGKVKYMLKYDKTEVCSDLERAVKLGFSAAAELMNLLYGPDKESTWNSISEGARRKAETLAKKNKK